MTHTSTEQQIAAAWNDQADEFNQWDELDLEEKIEWAAKYGASKTQRNPLTDAQCIEILKFGQSSVTMVRAIERAHGITQDKT